MISFGGHCYRCVCVCVGGGGGGGGEGGTGVYVLMLTRFKIADETTIK